MGTWYMLLTLATYQGHKVRIKTLKVLLINNFSVIKYLSNHLRGSWAPQYADFLRAEALSAGHFLLLLLPPPPLSLRTSQRWAPQYAEFPNTRNFIRQRH